MRGVVHIMYINFFRMQIRVPLPNKKSTTKSTSNRLRMLRGFGGVPRKYVKIAQPITDQERNRVRFFDSSRSEVITPPRPLSGAVPKGCLGQGGCQGCLPSDWLKNVTWSWQPSGAPVRPQLPSSLDIYV